MSPPTALFDEDYTQVSMDTTKRPNGSPWHLQAASQHPDAPSFLREVRQTLHRYRNFKRNTRNPNSILLNGTSLDIAAVTAVSRLPTAVLLDQKTRPRVDRSAAFVMDQVRQGADIYGVTTGFGATSHVRITDRTAELQNELVRFLNAGLTTGTECLAPGLTRAAMAVRANALLQGYSGIRFEVLEVLAALVNARLTPKVPLRGTITASGDLLPLSYVAAALAGRPNARVVTAAGEEVSARQALRMVGRAEPVALRAKEGLALCNGTAVAAAVAAVVCHDAGALVLLEVVLSAAFCEAMLGDAEFVDPLIHRLRGQPGQVEAAAIMKHFLDRSTFMDERAGRVAAAARVPNNAGGSNSNNNNGNEDRQDRYALRTAPQWLGPQMEVVGAAARTVERELNAVTDNPLIDVARGVALHGGNFQGTPIGVAMDNLRLALAAVGKLVFAQFSELVCGRFSHGLPDNLAGGGVGRMKGGGGEGRERTTAAWEAEAGTAEAPQSLDMGFKGAEIAMAAYCSELQWLGHPLTTHVQSAEQHNQDVNSLGLLSAQKSAEAVGILRMMLATYMLALCQAMDLRRLQAGSEGGGGAFEPRGCRTYPLYRFVREQAGARLLQSDGSSDLPCPGEFIERVHGCLEEDIGGLLLDLIDGSS